MKRPSGNISSVENGMKQQHKTQSKKEGKLQDLKGKLNYRRKHLCSTCGKTFTSRSNLRSHQVRMHSTGPKKHICKLCGRGFTHGQKFRVHLLKHLGAKDIECDVCGKKFYEKTEVRQHLTSHSQERPFACKLCSGTFKRRCNLVTHEASKHGIVSEGYQSHPCQVCGKTFLVARLLAEHVLSHSGEKFCCTKCGQQFVKRSSYINHVESDCNSVKDRASIKQPESSKITITQPWQCNVCGKIFKAKPNLNQHIRKVHEKDKQDKFCCTICGKLFKWKICLDEHVRIHLDLKPCICKICNKAFRTWSSLARHKQAHEDIRTYQCQICGKVFRHNSSLYTHLRIHSVVKPHPCGLCEQSFAYNNQKIKHLNKVHSRPNGTSTEDKDPLLLQ